jgi:carboxynorspermidine decarboxylase
VAYVEEHFGTYLREAKWINLGGGHHITRDDYDLDGLIRLVKYIRERYGIEVYLEPGEAIALNAGYLVTTVMDVVETDRIPVLILDTSAACHMPDVLEMPYRPPLRDSEQPGEMNYTYRLSSRTCLAGDIIGDYSFDTAKKVGDRLIFEDMAIYSFVKNNTFNGMPLPDIALRHPDGEVEVLKSFGYQDFKGRL